MAQQVLPRKKCKRCGNMKALMTMYSNNLQGPVCQTCFVELTTCLKCKSTFPIDGNCTKCLRQPGMAKMFHPHNGRMGFLLHDELNIDLETTRVNMTPKIIEIMHERKKELQEQNVDVIATIREEFGLN